MIEHLDFFNFQLLDPQQPKQNIESSEISDVNLSGFLSELSICF